MSSFTYSSQFFSFSVTPSLYLNTVGTYPLLSIHALNMPEPHQSTYLSLPTPSHTHYPEVRSNPHSFPLWATFRFHIGLPKHSVHRPCKFFLLISEKYPFLLELA